MKNIVQLAILTTLISTTANYCWEWSDIVPTRLQNWYRQIRQQEIQRVKALENKCLKDRYSDYLKKNPEALRQATIRQNEQMKDFYLEQIQRTRKSSSFNSAQKKLLIKDDKEQIQQYEYNVKLLEKYSPYKKPASSVGLRYKSMRKASKAGWGY